MVCTIYDGPFPDPRRQRLVVTREAFARGLPLVDLRLVCDEGADHADPIKPSVQGGAKIAAAVAGLPTEHEAGRHSIVVAR